MITLLTVLLVLAVIAVLAVIVSLLAGDGTPRPDDQDETPVPLPPARPDADLLSGGAHAAPMGRARVADARLVLDTPEHVSRHAAPEPPPAPWFTPRTDLYSPAFAATVGIDPAAPAGEQPTPRPDHGPGSLPHDYATGPCGSGCDNSPCPADRDHHRCAEACMATTHGAPR